MPKTQRKTHTVKQKNYAQHNIKYYTKPNTKYSLQLYTKHTTPNTPDNPTPHSECSCGEDAAVKVGRNSL